MDGFDHSVLRFAVGASVIYDCCPGAENVPCEVVAVEATVGGWMYRVWNDVLGGTWVFGDQLRRA